jgi:NUMOD1 domain
MPKMRPETKLKLSIVSIGVNVKVFDKKDNLIKEFPSINSAAKYFDVSSNTISKAIKKGTSYQNFTFKSEIKDNRV